MNSLALAIVVLACLVLVEAPAVADEDHGTHVNTTQGGLGIGANDDVDLGVGGGTQQGHTPVEPTVQVDIGTQLQDQFCTGVNWTASCDPTTGDGDPGDLQILVAEAFKYVPLPPSTLIVQPPNGRTLVNFDTNFYTDAPLEQHYSVPILSRVVELRVWPAQFVWRFGDGEELATTERGAAYPTLQITHRYLRKGQVGPRVDTTYAAQWRLPGQAWQPVAGTVTIEGQAAALDIVTATPTLVG